MGVWSRNPLRVVYSDTEPRSCRRRFAFAHGTLRGHLLAGEERFAVELARDGAVYYDALAFSRPGGLLARLTYPLARAQQRAFGRAAVHAVKKAMEVS